MKYHLPIVAAAFLVSTSVLCAVPGDEHWDAQFGWPGPGGEILSIATQNGDIYASGLFSPTNAPVEVWNGAQWSTIGQVHGYPQAIVYDMAFVGNDLYIAGTFTNVNGVAATGLARWDGANWSSVGFSGSLTALAVSGNNLYVGGFFTNSTADGGIATNIASWDGAAWHMLGGGLGGAPGAGSGVEAITLQSGLVYAGGGFTNSGSLLITNLAVWNGSSWSALGGPFNSAVYALSFNGGNLIAGGVFGQIGATAASGVAQWNGSSWSALGGGVAGGSPFSEVTRLAVLGGTVYASGAFTSAGGVAATNIASWNGTSWSPLGSGVSSTITRLTSSGTNLYVGGNFLLAGGTIANGLASWNGANWSAFGSSGRLNGVALSVSALAGDGINLYSGGTFIAAGQSNANYVARFDGANWHPLGSGIGPSGSSVRALAIATNGLYVGGQFSSAGGVSAANIAFWNGTNWSALGGGPGGVVASILVRTDGIYAVGAPFGTSSYGSPFFMRWDGTNWNNSLALTNSFFAEMFNTPNITMDALASSGTNIFVGGEFNFAQGDQNYLSDATSCPDIFQYNGNFAYIMGTGVNSNVLAMAALGTNLYVGGYFTNAGGIAASHIAMWDGANWHALGGGVMGNGNVVALTAIGTNLYAGGNFTNMGGVSAYGVARWDGNNWWPLGGGVLRGGLPSSASALGSSGNDLYAGGIFQVAGNKASYTVGHWNDQINFNTPQLINPKWLPAGQFQTRIVGVPGVTNFVQASTNFIVWIPVLTNSSGIYDFTDSNSAAYPYRFYRGVLSQ
jgi:trimeric autotransporter adhesin